MAVLLRNNLGIVLLGLSQCVQKTLARPPRLFSLQIGNVLIKSKRRSHSIIGTLNGACLDVQKTCINLQNSSWPRPLQLNHLWLRDHCRCSACYNHVTHQRITDLLSIPSDIEPVKCQLEGNNLVVSWPDNHVSSYAVDWLWKNSYCSYVEGLPQPTPVLWNADSIDGLVARVERRDIMDSETSLKDLVRSVIDYGVGIVENDVSQSVGLIPSNDVTTCWNLPERSRTFRKDLGATTCPRPNEVVPATLCATEEVVRRVASVQHTLFGSMWEFSNAEMAHSDTAYTNQALGAHTDNTYFNEAAGLQIFHCFYHDGAGGETLLVDGFWAARNLQLNFPESYRLLTSTPIESEYLEAGQHYSSMGPVLRPHLASQALQQVRFNLYDRAPMRAVPAESVPQFYEALKRFSEAVREPKAEWWLKLKPGMVIFIDNWRVLHGRASYTGLRKIGGCYVNRSDFLSKARVLGII